MSDALLTKVAEAIHAEVKAWRLQTDGSGRYRAVKNGYSRELMGGPSREEAEAAFETLVDEQCATVALRAATEWQPINTAPRDNTPVLLYAEAWDMTWGVQIGSFSLGKWLTAEGEVDDNDPDFDPDAEVDDDEDFDLDANTGPTHWMPLPKPPGDHP